jgi:hypothetical protein
LQRKWTGIYSKLMQTKLQIKNSMLSTKNKLKDNICFSSTLFKKYDWFLEEITHLDFYDSIFVNEVVDDEVEWQNILFKISIFRW